MSAVKKQTVRASVQPAARRKAATNDFISLNMEDEDEDDEPVLIESSAEVDSQNCLPIQTMLPVQHTSQRRDGNHYVTQLEYEGEDEASLNRSGIPRLKHLPNIQSDNTDEIEYSFPQKRKRTSSGLVNTVGLRGQEYDSNSNVMYEYDAEYDAASVMSESSYTGDQQRILAEVLNYCQAMYDIVQKLDKKMDVLQRKVSDMHHVRLRPRPFVLPHRSSPLSAQFKIRQHKLNQRVLSPHLPPPPQGYHPPPLRMKVVRNVRLQPPTSFKPGHARSQSIEPQQRSPPLPTIISTHSLQTPFSVSDTQNNNSQDVVEVLPESTCVSSPIISASVAPPLIRQTTSEANFKEEDPLPITHVASPGGIIMSEEQPSSSVPTIAGYEFLGNPARNIKIPGTYLMKARQKTRPKYSARYLFRILFSKETLIGCATGTNAQSLSSLDVNIVSAVREFLTSTFPECDLCEHGKDWKTCITNINSMIRTLQAEAKTITAIMYPNQTAPQKTEESICVDSDAEEDEKVFAEVLEKPHETTASATIQPSTTVTTTVDQQYDNELEVILPGSLSKQPPYDPLEQFGEVGRNVQLPFSVIYIAKGKSRPELSARYLIRHLFTEDVLVKSNVYGNLERGVLPLDSNKMSALRDFLQENYPSFDLKESGYDWKACVAAINSTIRSLRHDQKKAALQTHKKIPYPVPKK
ncbi:BEN domain-containing protein 2 [Pelobates fuscus]|uniref:BEN domain-containing protein 2 n=1 Tax=Pelobates fuscus TaxID=191477 RepID=UPI002FE4A62A